MSEIANSADVMGASADQVTNFEVKIRILDKAAFRPGMTATVEIQTSDERQILSVPIQAVTTRKDTTDKQEKIIDQVNKTKKIYKLLLKNNLIYCSFI